MVSYINYIYTTASIRVLRIHVKAIMDYYSEEQIVVVGLLWTLIETEKKRQVGRRLQAIRVGQGIVRRRRPRRWWVRPWLDADRRLNYGHYNRLMEELRLEDCESFRNFLRVEPAMFDELLNRIGPRITKQNTFYRKSLDPGLKLACTLRHLATGNSYRSLAYDFRVRHIRSGGV